MNQGVYKPDSFADDTQRQRVSDIYNRLNVNSIPVTNALIDSERRAKIAADMSGGSSGGQRMANRAYTLATT